MLTALDREVAAFWARRFRKSTHDGLRIAVVGGCQAFGIAYGMRLLLPDAQADCFTVAPGSLTHVSALVRVLKTYDLVFCSDFGPGFVRGGASSDVLVACGARRYPLIVFAGFHPDFIYVHPGGNPARNLAGATGPYHSALTIFGFLSGLAPDQTVALFDREIYERLGYFEMWNEAAARLLSDAKTAGIDLAPHFLRWSRRGCFMHTVNHPKAHVLFDLARAMLSAAGIATPDLDFDQYAFDPLAGLVILPVYEPLAEQLGLPGHYLFRPAGPRRSGVLSLREFIARSYRVYAGLPKGALSAARVEALLADHEVAAALCAFANAEKR